MSQLLRILIDSAALWIYLQAIWYFIISIVYYFSIPWIIWGSLIIIVLLWLVKNPPPDPKIVNQVLGVDPFTLQRDELTSESLSNGESFCMRVIAHRGGGYDYPENSLSAIDNTKKKGCNTVEFDLRLTKDNIPIVFHDCTIERLTGKYGVVKDMTWNELKQLDISFNHPLKEKFDKAETIMHFNEAIEQCLNYNLHMFIDIKDPSLEIAHVILNAYKKYPELYQKAIVTSFHPFIIYLIRRRESRIVTSLSYKRKCFSTFLYDTLDIYGPLIAKNPFKYSAVKLFDAFYEWALPRFVYFVLGISVILLHKDSVSMQTINEWNSRGIRLIAWSINLPSEKVHYSKILKLTYLTDTLLTEKVT